MRKDPYQVLAETSRTFFLPIQRLPEGLREAVASAYLSLRAIDEIEDHRGLPPAVRSRLLRGVRERLDALGPGCVALDFGPLFCEFEGVLPEVTLRLAEWCELAPSSIRLRVADSTAAMAGRMAAWVERDFRVGSEQDLDRYTFAVAGSVGLLLADLWQWWDGTATDRTLAVGFGRGLQAVNVLRNRDDDLAHGVDFHPPGWDRAEMLDYARRQLAFADRYADALPAGPVREFCAMPLALAHGTLEAIERGREKLTREEVAAILARCV